MNLLVPLLGYTAAAALLTLTPGVDTAMVLRSATAGGPRNGIATAAGICLGLLIWGMGAASGLSLLLAASRTAFTVVKLCGALYLLWLGVQMLRAPKTAHAAEGAAPAPAGIASAFRRGLASNILNPKVGVFYITFLPQFIPSGVDVPLFSMLLTSINLGLDLLWFGAIIALTVPLGAALARPAVRRTMDRVTGCTLIGFGLRLGLTR
ncbi:MAG TPA: LysE family translocator [Acidocella sp.]|nr:LysE family translocator [Acidocella sp.]